MADFPTINRRGTELHNPIVGDFEDTIAHDPTIRSRSEGGYVTTRARFTRIPRKWTIKYDWVTKANKNTIKTFEDDTVVGGSANFDWLNPENSATYDVRFLGLIRYAPHPDTNFLWWIIEFELEEV